MSTIILEKDTLVFPYSFRLQIWPWRLAIVWMSGYVEDIAMVRCPGGVGGGGAVLL